MEKVNRGDIVSVTLKGDLGKPRPALVIQSDFFNEFHGTVTVLPITSEIISAPLFRMTIEPSQENGLRKVSQVMVDKISTIKRDKIGGPIGRLHEDVLLRVTRALAVWVGIVQ